MPPGASKQRRGRKNPLSPLSLTLPIPTFTLSLSTFLTESTFHIKTTRRKLQLIYCVGAGYREKLLPSIKHKCVYGTWNDRGSIFTMGFKLNCPEDLAALKSMENIYKEESHIHQFIVPFETAVWNEEDLAPARRAQVRDATAGDQAATPQVQDPTSSGSQNANQSNASSEQTSTALPQRETQTRGGSLPTE